MNINMDNHLKKAFKNIEFHPEMAFSSNIWRAICERENKTAKIKIWLYSATAVISLADFVPAVMDLGKDFAQSGFSEYLSLAFSDSGAILKYWREFMMALAGALPAVSVALCLTLLFIFIGSAWKAGKQIKNLSLSNN